MLAGTTAPALDLGQIIEDLLPDIRTIVHKTLRRLSRRYLNHEIDDLCQQIVLLLMEDGFRRLRSFDHASSHKTWLTTVVRNHVINHLQRQKTTVSLNDVSPEAIVYPARQEERVFEHEQRDSVQAAIANLTKRELRLFELLLCVRVEHGRDRRGNGYKSPVRAETQARGDQEASAILPGQSVGTVTDLIGSQTYPHSPPRCV